MTRILLKGCRLSAPRWRSARCVCAVVTFGWDVAIACDESPMTPDVEVATPPQAEPPQPDAPARDEPQPAPPPRLDIEGAIGPMVSLSPEYQGAARWTVKTIPGIFLRWGRYTITNASGFVTRRDDDVLRGLAADLLRSEHWRANLALRIDRGRSTQDSAALSGLSDIRRTIRGRLIVTRNFDQGWSTTLGTSVDLLARGGGTLVDFGPSKDIALPWGEPWHKMRISIGMAVTGADRRYMQSYFGVTAQQAVITGYPEYAPPGGLRDISAGVSLRGHYGERWVGYFGVAASHLLGPAHDSPLSQRASSWSVNGGLAWRFF